MPNSPSGVQSGQYGNITVQQTSYLSPYAATGDAEVVTEATNWQMQRSAVSGAYASNKTKGWRRRVTGTKDVTGSIGGVYDVTLPIETQLDIGKRVYLRLYTSATKGHAFYARITGGPNYGMDIAEGNVPTWECSWEMDDPDPQFNINLTAIPAVTVVTPPTSATPVYP